MIGRTFALTTLLTLAACSPSSSVAGTYDLDKIATRKAFDAKLQNAALPAPQKAALEARTKELGNTDLHAEYQLKTDATYHGHQQLFAGGHEDVQGTWKADGNTVTFTQTLVEGKAAPATYTGTITGNELHLTLGSGDNGFTLVLRKK